MFDSLIESRRSVALGGALSGGAVSMAVHCALITGAVYATLHASEVRKLDRLIVPVPMLREQEKPPLPHSQASVLDLLRVAAPRLVISIDIPAQIPPPSASPFDPTAFYRGGSPGGDSGSAPGASPSIKPGELYRVEFVEERPERIGGPAPRYPEILRQAGIDGRVLVECVVDTNGRAERGSVQIVSSTNQMFDQPAREAVAASIFRPGRISGRAVRVRVQVPLNFQVSRGPGNL